MFLDFYKKCDKGKLEEFSYNYFIRDLLDRKLTGPEKTREITGLQMEESMKHLFIPSLIYIFMYSPKEQSVIGKARFVDNVPIIFCTGYDDGIVSGINLNMISNSARASFLDIVYKTNPKFYDNVIYTNSPDKINEKLANVIITDHGRKLFMDAVSKNIGSNASIACRRYSVGCISNVRMIEYDMWKYIPCLSFKDSIRGASLAEIQIEGVLSGANK